MRSINLKIMPIYMLLLFYILFSSPWINLFNSEIGSAFLNLLYWIVIAGYIYLVIGFKKGRIRRETDKIQTILIILIIYFMAYFFTGLLFGYQKSPYSHDLLAIISNIWKFIPVILMEEFTRYHLVQEARGKITWYAVIVILFIFVDVNLSTIATQCKTLEEAFKFVCSTITPSVFRNILLVFLARKAGLKSLFIYQVAFALFDLLIPIFPDLDWFFTGIIGMILPVIVYFNINYIEMSDERFLSRRQIRKESPLKLIPTFVIVFLVVGFVGGFFTYQPIAIISNSMVPKFARGDAVIVQKISDEAKKDLKEGTIIRFQTTEKEVVHRIKEKKVKSDGTVAYITKGDNNNAEDVGEVTPDQIKGVVVYSVPKIGYPSVWLYELFQRNK